MTHIPFSLPTITIESMSYVGNCLTSRYLQGGGPFSKRTSTAIAKDMDLQKILLTSSCTDALEMTALLLDLQEGDEIIMPSYTFPSTATAYALRSAVPVFVDIRPDTINIDETLIEAAITDKTKAIVVVHYAGISCALDPILALAKKHNLYLIEDAAHSYGATYKGKSLGSFGALGTYSFHNSKNISAGEGGALIINDPSFAARAEILHEKGTNRSSFIRGDAAFYEWQDIGSSFVMSDLTAAFLLGQVEHASKINKDRLRVWNHYHKGLEDLEAKHKIQRPTVPKDCAHNAHLYYILLENAAQKEPFLAAAKENDMTIVPHYVPLHSAPAGRKFGRVSGDMSVTNDIADRLVRLPLYADLSIEDADRVIDFVTEFVNTHSNTNILAERATAI